MNTLERLIELVIEAEGGAKYHFNQGEKSGTKYGIYGFANGLTDEQVKALTLDKAVVIYKSKYATPDVLDAIEAKDFIKASLLFNMNVNLGLTGKNLVLAMANSSKESIGESLVRYYKGLKSADLYFYGWTVRVARNYEMGYKLLKEFT
jgi:lysozyme family protein